jgi:hypothetical protein
MINIKDRLPIYDEIEKMIEEEFRNHPMVEEVSKIEVSDPSVRGKYSTRLYIDEQLDDINSIRAKIRNYVNEEVCKAIVEIGKEY